MDEIVFPDSGCSGQAESDRILGLISVRNPAMAVVVLVAFGALFYTYIQSNKGTIHKYLKGNINLSYQTLVTSDLNKKERAGVYSTDLLVDDAVKVIIQAIDGGTEDVQRNGEGDSVVILTKSEHCLACISTDQTTVVQISSRVYVYQSINTSYRVVGHTHSYYRGFYYSRRLFGDRDRYRQRASGCEDHSDETVDTNPVDPYKSYLDSVRQSSINPRRSPGDGINSGRQAEKAKKVGG